MAVRDPQRKSAQLLRRIHRRYQTVTRPMQFGTLTIPFTRIADPDRVLDDVAAAADLRERLSGQRESDPQHLPYWAELWDSAIGMATYLAGRSNLGPHVSVLDLGCGMGLSGTVAAAMGCQVLFADMEQEALLFGLLNTADYDTRARRLNWQTDRLGEQFDLILGADILYERKQWPYLEAFWRAHLAPTGRVLIGEPGRPTGDDFPAWITPQGWSFTSREQVVPTRDKPVRLFSMQMQKIEPRRHGGTEARSTTDAPWQSRSSKNAL